MIVLVVMLTLGTIGVAIWSLVSGLRVSNGLIPAFWSVVAQGRDTVRHTSSFCALHVSGVLLCGAMHHTPPDGSTKASGNLAVQVQNAVDVANNIFTSSNTLRALLTAAANVVSGEGWQADPYTTRCLVDSLRSMGCLPCSSVQCRGLPRCTVNQHPPEVDSMRLMSHQPCRFSLQEGAAKLSTVSASLVNAGCLRYCGIPCPADLQTELSQVSTTLTNALPISDIQTALQTAANGIASAVTTGQTTVNQVVSKGIQVGRLDSFAPCSHFSPAGPCTRSLSPAKQGRSSPLHRTSLLACCHASLPLALRSAG